MSLVIVTKRCFLTCEKVTSITIKEYDSERKQSIKSSKKKKTKTPTRFTLQIAYIPEGNYTQTQGSGFGSKSSTEEHSIELDIFGEKETFALYTEVVNEIREQSPDSAYLDSLVAKILTDNNIPEEDGKHVVNVRMT